MPQNPLDSISTQDWASIDPAFGSSATPQDGIGTTDWASLAADAQKYTAPKLRGVPKAKLDQINAVANRLKLPAWALARVMKAESGLSTTAQHPGSKATGLIQFMPSTLKELGYTAGSEAFRKLSFEQQMPFVEKYLQKRGAAGASDPADIYWSVLAGNPKAAPFKKGDGSGKYEGQGVKGKNFSPLDRNKDGVITKEEAWEWTSKTKGIVNSIAQKTADAMAVKPSPDARWYPELDPNYQNQQAQRKKALAAIDQRARNDPARFKSLIWNQRKEMYEAERNKIQVQYPTSEEMKSGAAFGSAVSAPLKMLAEAPKQVIDLASQANAAGRELWEAGTRAAFPQNKALQNIANQANWVGALGQGATDLVQQTLAPTYKQLSDWGGRHRDEVYKALMIDPKGRTLPVLEFPISASWIGPDKKEAVIDERVSISADMFGAAIGEALISVGSGAIAGKAAKFAGLGAKGIRGSQQAASTFTSLPRMSAGDRDRAKQSTDPLVQRFPNTAALAATGAGMILERFGEKFGVFGGGTAGQRALSEVLSEAATEALQELSSAAITRTDTSPAALAENAILGGIGGFSGSILTGAVKSTPLEKALRKAPVALRAAAASAGVIPSSPGAPSVDISQTGVSENVTVVENIAQAAVALTEQVENAVASQEKAALVSEQLVLAGLMDKEEADGVGATIALLEATNPELLETLKNAGLVLGSTDPEARQVGARRIVELTASTAGQFDVPLSNVARAAAYIARQQSEKQPEVIAEPSVVEVPTQDATPETVEAPEVVEAPADVVVADAAPGMDGFDYDAAMQALVSDLNAAGVLTKEELNTVARVMIDGYISDGSPLNALLWEIVAQQDIFDSADSTDDQKSAAETRARQLIDSIAPFLGVDPDRAKQALLTSTFPPEATVAPEEIVPQVAEAPIVEDVTVTPPVDLTQNDPGSADVVVADAAPVDVPPPAQEAPVPEVAAPVEEAIAPEASVTEKPAPAEDQLAEVRAEIAKLTEEIDLSIYRMNITQSANAKKVLKAKIARLESERSELQAQLPVENTEKPKKSRRAIRESDILPQDLEEFLTLKQQLKNPLLDREERAEINARLKEMYTDKHGLDAPSFSMKAMAVGVNEAGKSNPIVEEALDLLDYELGDMSLADAATQWPNTRYHRALVTFAGYVAFVRHGGDSAQALAPLAEALLSVARPDTQPASTRLEQLLTRATLSPELVAAIQSRLEQFNQLMDELDVIEAVSGSPDTYGMHYLHAVVLYGTINESAEQTLDTLLHELGHYVALQAGVKRLTNKTSPLARQLWSAFLKDVEQVEFNSRATPPSLAKIVLDWDLYHSTPFTSEGVRDSETAFAEWFAEAFRLHVLGERQAGGFSEAIESLSVAPSSTAAQGTRLESSLTADPARRSLMDKVLKWLQPTIKAFQRFISRVRGVVGLEGSFAKMTVVDDTPNYSRRPVEDNSSAQSAVLGWLTPFRDAYRAAALRNPSLSATAFLGEDKIASSIPVWSTLNQDERNQYLQLINEWGVIQKAEFLPATTYAQRAAEEEILGFTDAIVMTTASTHAEVIEEAQRRLEDDPNAGIALAESLALRVGASIQGIMQADPEVLLTAAQESQQKIEAGVSRLGLGTVEMVMLYMTVVRARVTVAHATDLALALRDNLPADATEADKAEVESAITSQRRAEQLRDVLNALYEASGGAVSAPLNIRRALVKTEDYSPLELARMIETEFWSSGNRGNSVSEAIYTGIQDDLRETFIDSLKARIEILEGSINNVKDHVEAAEKKEDKPTDPTKPESKQPSPEGKGRDLITAEAFDLFERYQSYLKELSEQLNQANLPLEEVQRLHTEMRAIEREVRKGQEYIGLSVLTGKQSPQEILERLQKAKERAAKGSTLPMWAIGDAEPNGPIAEIRARHSQLLHDLKQRMERDALLEELRGFENPAVVDVFEKLRGTESEKAEAEVAIAANPNLFTESLLKAIKPKPETPTIEATWLQHLARLARADALRELALKKKIRTLREAVANQRVIQPARPGTPRKPSANEARLQRELELAQQEYAEFLKPLEQHMATLDSAVTAYYNAAFVGIPDADLPSDAAMQQMKDWLAAQPEARTPRPTPVAQQVHRINKRTAQVWVAAASGSDLSTSTVAIPAHPDVLAAQRRLEAARMMMKAARISREIPTIWDVLTKLARSWQGLRVQGRITDVTWTALRHRLVNRGVGPYVERIIDTVGNARPNISSLTKEQSGLIKEVMLASPTNQGRGLGGGVERSILAIFMQLELLKQAFTDPSSLSHELLQYGEGVDSSQSKNTLTRHLSLYGIGPDSPTASVAKRIDAAMDVAMTMFSIPDIGPIFQTSELVRSKMAAKSASAQVPSPRSSPAATAQWKSVYENKLANYKAQPPVMTEEEAENFSNEMQYASLAHSSYLANELQGLGRRWNQAGFKRKGVARGMDSASIQMRARIRTRQGWLQVGLPQLTMGFFFRMLVNLGISSLSLLSLPVNVVRALLGQLAEDANLAGVLAAHSHWPSIPVGGMIATTIAIGTMRAAAKDVAQGDERQIRARGMLKNVWILGTISTVLSTPGAAAPIAEWLGTTTAYKSQANDVSSRAKLFELRQVGNDLKVEVRPVSPLQLPVDAITPYLLRGVIANEKAEFVKDNLKANAITPEQAINALKSIAQDEARFTFSGAQRVSNIATDFSAGDWDQMAAALTRLGINWTTGFTPAPVIAGTEMMLKGGEYYGAKPFVAKDKTDKNSTQATWVNAFMARMPVAQFSVPIHDSGHTFPGLPREHQLEFLRARYSPSVTKPMSPGELAVAKNPSTVEEARLQNEGSVLLIPAVMNQLMESDLYLSLPYNNVAPEGESRDAVLRRAVSLSRSFGLIGWVDVAAAEMVAWMALNNQTIPSAVTVEELRAMNAGAWPTFLATLRQEAIDRWNKEGRKYDAIGASLSRRLSVQKQLLPFDRDQKREEMRDAAMDSRPLPSFADGLRDGLR